MVNEKAYKVSYFYEDENNEKQALTLKLIFRQFDYELCDCEYMGGTENV